MDAAAPTNANRHEAAVAAAADLGCAEEEEEYHRQENHAFFQVPVYDLAESGNNQCGTDWRKDGFFHFDEPFVRESCM